MIEVIEYNPCDSGCNKGTISVKMHKWGGFVLAGLTIMQKGTSRWISFPNYKKDVGGEIKWLPVAYYETNEMQKRLSVQILRALDEYVKPTVSIKENLSEPASPPRK
jgi:hypothetical protein